MQGKVDPSVLSAWMPEETIGDPRAGIAAHDNSTTKAHACLACIASLQVMWLIGINPCSVGWQIRLVIQPQVRWK
jgi:hypothetical protein